MPPTTKNADWVGQTLSKGRYEIKSKLGEGGMGCVYRARDRKLDSDVIIKVPRPALLLDPEFVARFTREVRALVKLEHPHIVRVMDVDQHTGAPFAVMQFLGGGSLEDRQVRQADDRFKHMPVDELRSWLPHIAAALDFVHQQGFVHRDVKPANILFDQRGHAFLSDFGVAKAVAETGAGPAASLTGTGVVLGTPAYMAPEMALGKPYDGRIDQYALAVTVYELLAGRLPFEGPTPSAILLKQTSEAPPRLDKLCPRVSSAVADAVHRALAKEPAKRYPTCMAFAQAIQRAAQGKAEVQVTGKALSFEPLSLDEPSVTRQRVFPLAGMLALTVAALVLVVGIAWVVLIRQLLLASPAQPGRLSLSSDAVALTPGKNYHVEVRIDRAGYEGPIEIEVLNLPPRVSYNMPKIPADWSSGQLELRPAANASPKEQTATIRTRLGGTVLEQPLRVTVRDGPGVLADNDPPHQPPHDGTLPSPSETNSLGMRFVTIPAGEYVRGSPADDPDAEPNERPQQRVRITRPFEMAIYEVTVGQFRKFVEAEGYKTDAESSGEGSDGYDPALRTYVQENHPTRNWRNVGWSLTDNHPVSSVSWNDASAFCRWLSRKEGRTYRLPTEAEWEYAARAGTKTRFWTGDSEDSLKGFENLADLCMKRSWNRDERVQPWDDGSPFSAPVGSFKPNPWGLYDILGNVCETTSDWHNPDSHKEPVVTDPIGPTTGEFHTLRGGSWYNEARHARPAFRWGFGKPDYRDGTYGFRVVREVGN